MRDKAVITIIFDGKLWSCKWSYRYASLERKPIWDYPKIGPWVEIMISVDVDLSPDVDLSISYIARFDRFLQLKVNNNMLRSVLTIIGQLQHAVISSDN